MRRSDVKIEIKHRFTGNIICGGDFENLQEAVENNKYNLSNANLSYANLSNADLSNANLYNANLSYADLYNAYLYNAYLSNADLSNANLSYANLSNANLSNANLSNADLSNANLSNADLSNANLSYANLKNIPHLNHLTINEYIKKYDIKQKGTKIIVYKGVDNKLKSPANLDAQIFYKKNKTVTVDFANADIFTSCGHGINLCPTLELAKQWGNRLIKVEVDIGDIVCIPLDDEKFRVKKCKVLGEIK